MKAWSFWLTVSCVFLLLTPLALLMARRKPLAWRTEASASWTAVNRH